MLTFDFSTLIIGLERYCISSQLVKVRAEKPSEPLGFLVSSPYSLSYGQKADNYTVKITK